jgi:hypothetical protein
VVRMELHGGVGNILPGAKKRNPTAPWPTCDGLSQEPNAQAIIARVVGGARPGFPSFIDGPSNATLPDRPLPCYQIRSEYSTSRVPYALPEKLSRGGGSSAISRVGAFAFVPSDQPRYSELLNKQWADLPSIYTNWGRYLYMVDTDPSFRNLWPARRRSGHGGVSYEPLCQPLAGQ